MACFSSFFIFLLCIILVWHRAVCQQLYNVTVDDGDARISYTGNWQQSTPTELDLGGRHMIGLDPDASAVFSFRGVAVYFLSPLWPYNLTTLIQLDSGPPTLLYLQDHNSPENFGGSETVASRVILGFDKLVDQPHQLKISVMDQFAVVDGFIVTMVNQNESLTNLTTTAGSTTTAATAATAGSSQITASTATALAVTASPSTRESRADKSAVPIGVGIGLGILALLVAAMIFYKFCYRRRAVQASRQMVEPDVEKYSLPSTIGPPPECATPSEPTPPGPDSGITDNPSSPPPIQTALENLGSSPPKYDTIRLQPPTSPSPTQSILRRITFNRPPPAYHESLDLLRYQNYPALELPQPAPLCTKERSST